MKVLKPTILVAAIMAVLFAGCDKPEPIASFTASTYTPSIDEVVSFTNSSQNATSYTWDFGDGTSSTVPSPTHVFTQAGTFNVQLVAEGEGGTNTAAQIITVNSPEPEAAFTMDKSTAQAYELISFFNSSENAETYLWDFGDSQTSTEVNPVHAYEVAGSYTVQLTATGDGGSNTTSQPVTITEPVPLASFVADKSIAKPGDTISFTNYSLFATQYSWDFGDGTTSTAEQTTHSYAEVGTFTVTLTATGVGGSDVDSKSIIITENTDFNIYPGDRIGNFVLGNNLLDHFTYISEDEYGYYGEDLGDGFFLHLMEFDTAGIGFVVITEGDILYYDDIPGGFYVFDPFECITETGITFGNTLETVEAAYGTPDEITEEGSYSYIPSLGISFWADESQTLVEMIFIQEPTGTEKGSALNHLRFDRLKPFTQRQVSGLH